MQIASNMQMSIGFDLLTIKKVVYNQYSNLMAGSG